MQHGAKIQRDHTSAIQFNAQLLNPGVVFICALVHEALLLNLANDQKNDQWVDVTTQAAVILRDSGLRIRKVALPAIAQKLRYPPTTCHLHPPDPATAAPCVFVKLHASAQALAHLHAPPALLGERLFKNLKAEGNENAVSSKNMHRIHTPCPAQVGWKMGGQHHAAAKRLTNALQHELAIRATGCTRLRIATHSVAKAGKPGVRDGQTALLRALCDPCHWQFKHIAIVRLALMHG